MFEGHKCSAADLQKGITSEPAAPTCRNIVDVTKWNDIRNVMIIPGELGRTQKKWSGKLDTPYALNE